MDSPVATCALSCETPAVYPRSRSTPVRQPLQDLNSLLYYLAADGALLPRANGSEPGKKLKQAANHWDRVWNYPKVRGTFVLLPPNYHLVIIQISNSFSSRGTPWED